MRPRFLHRLLPFLLLVCIPASALAKSSPEAERWLDKMLRVYEGGPFRTAYTMDMQVDQMGMQLDMHMDGQLTARDQRTMRNEITITMSGAPQMPEGMQMAMLQVSDGQTSWMQMSMNGMPMQVMKMDLDQMQALAADALADMGLAANAALQMQDPVSQLQTMTQFLDFEVAGENDGKVTLHARPNDQFSTVIDSLATEQGDSTVSAASKGIFELIGDLEMVLDEKTGFPVSMTTGGEPPIMRVDFSSFERLDAEALDSSLFVFTVPEGASVMDVGEMLKTQKSGN